MKFLIDAQLPYRLKLWLIENQFDAIHTDDLPERNLTADLTIADFADQECRTVISKDSDFLKLRIFAGQTAETFNDYDGQCRQQRVTHIVQAKLCDRNKTFQFV